MVPPRSFAPRAMKHNNSAEMEASWIRWLPMATPWAIGVESGASIARNRLDEDIMSAQRPTGRRPMGSS